ncbi:MAG: MATE family efflux transporter [Ruminococcaceae bacterium]|nr:MATE family efflux transporter [Oscillospiraceae bacterium]
MSPEEKRTFMLTTPIPRLIPNMALPSIAAMLVTSAYNLADTFFVSKLGTYATGAVGVNSAIDSIIMMAGSLLAVGAASFSSRLLGAREDEHAKCVVSTSFFLAFLMGVAVLVFGNLFRDPLLRLLGATDALMPYSRDYCRYILLAAPFMASSFALNQCLRAEGSAVFSMVGMVTGAILNIGLDPIFIFTFGWGVAGASAATAISKLVSWCILMYPYIRKKTLLVISPKYFRPNWPDLGEVCAVGFSSFVRNALSTFAAVVLNRIAVGFGESVLAAVSVSNRITMFMTAACLGYGQGFQPVAGFSWGAKRYDRLQEANRFAMSSCVISISVVALLVGIFAEPLLLLFTESDAEMIRVGVFSLRSQCLAMPFHGYCIIVSMLCAGIGRARAAAVLGMSRQGICFFPVLPLMVWAFGRWGVASVQGVGDILSMIPALIIARKVAKEVDALA